MNGNKSNESDIMGICGLVELVDGAIPTILWQSLPFSRWDLLRLLPWGNWVGGSTRYARLPEKGKFLTFWHRTNRHGLGIIVKTMAVPTNFSLVASEILDELSWWDGVFSELRNSSSTSSGLASSIPWDEMFHGFYEVINGNSIVHETSRLPQNYYDFLNLFPPLSLGTLLFLLLVSARSDLNFQVFLNGTHEKILSFLDLLLFLLPREFVINALNFVSMSGTISYLGLTETVFLGKGSDKPNDLGDFGTLALIGIGGLPSSENLSYLQAMALCLEVGKIQPGILIDHPLIRQAEMLMRSEPLAVRHWLTHEILPLGEQSVYEDIFSHLLS